MNYIINIFSKFKLKLSKSPLKSKFSSEINDKAQKWILNYNADSSSNQLETIEYFSDLLPIMQSINKDFDIITCNIDLDNSTSAFLCDAFTQKEYSEGKIAKVCIVSNQNYIQSFSIIWTML